MKKLQLIFIFFLSIVTVTKAQNASEASKYLSSLTILVEETKKETWQYLKSVTRGKGAKKVDGKRQSLISELGKVKNQLNKKDAYYGDESLKLALVSYIDLTHIVLKEDYDKILDMEDIAEQSYDSMEAYLLAQEKASEKMDEAFEILKKAQDDFAAKYDITLIESEGDKTDQKIKKANAALKYYNEIYLIFFKVYKQEAYVIEALNAQDVNSLEQNINSLQTLTVESLAKLKDAKTYNGDGGLKLAANKVILFYEKEATEYFPKFTDFYLKKDNFEKVRKAFEAKNDKSRTQEDVDQFNKAVDEYNAATAEFNKYNQLANIGRAEALNVWKQKVEIFFDKHTK
jgi:hypothetical protein